MWHPKSDTTAAVEERLLNPAVGIPPGEFTNIELAELEGELEEAHYANDEWVRTEQKDSVGWARSDSSTSKQREVPEWLDPGALHVHVSLETHVLNDLLLAWGPFSMGAADPTLKHLAAHGCDKDRKLAGQGLIDFGEMRCGGKERAAYCGEYEGGRGVFVRKVAQVGMIRFIAIDLGGYILLDAMARRVSGTADRKERGQCAISHQGEAIGWHSRGKGETYPTRGIICHQSMLTRNEEAAQAKESEKCTGQTTTAKD